jgi:hypothetical protein
VSEQRYGTTVEDGTVYVDTPDRRVPVGEVERVLDHVGGSAWRVEYPQEQKRRYPDLDTSDEGLVVDVVDVINAMTLDRSFVETLAAQPDRTHGAGDTMPPRLGMFVGRLMSDLQYGVN